ncbi:Mannose-specific lectin [Acorus calamus]|uniref:Mannose-specific lectin n=1 Tax=Acorus calamus TaxID=4465 RepID=A0AAV9DCX9_ACOCL|nr:Mannose-specific lectin [Acorus calamus]
MATPTSSIPISSVLLIILFSFTSADNTLFSSGILTAGKYLSYNNYQLIMQKDCDLVLYDSGKPVWSSGSKGKARQCYVELQSDGNLVVYGEGTVPVWASKTNVGIGNYVLVLQPDRNVVIYGGAIWSSATNARGAELL